MQSKAATIDKYITEAPQERQDALKKLRILFLQELKGYEEKMAYGGPCYAKNDNIEAGFGSQKNFIGIYILKQKAFKKYIDEFKNCTHGKGVIRFSKPEKIDFTLLQKMLKATYEMEDEIC